MAGSYNHCVNEDGTLDLPDLSRIENLGDAKEAIEEMYGMIWWLAQGQTYAVESARQNYKLGISEFAPGEQKALW